MYCGLWLSESNPPFTFPSVVQLHVCPVVRTRPLQNGGGDFSIVDLQQIYTEISWGTNKQRGSRTFYVLHKNSCWHEPTVTFSFAVSSCWWWESFLWRTSECFSLCEWGRQLTVSLMDSAAAKRLDSADTHWPRESRRKTMTKHAEHERRSSAGSHWSLRFPKQTNKVEVNIQSRICKCDREDTSVDWGQTQTHCHPLKSSNVT